MSTYATQLDVANYIEGWVAGDPAALERLIKRAEKDVDHILGQGSLTDAIIGISLSNATGQNFALGLNWRGVGYVSPPISWNALGVDVVAALQNMTNGLGARLPPGVWSMAESKYANQQWAFGPLPGVPVVVEAINSLGGQALPDLTIVNNGLSGIDAQITIQTIVGGGLRVNPYQLPATYSDALRNATCAQVEYRYTMGEDFFVRAQWNSVSGPEFKTTGKLPRIGPKVLQELQGTDLIQRGARARPGTSTGRQKVFAPSGTTPFPDDWRSI